MSVHELESMVMGRALAAQSHELKNVLAIVGEGAGLMEDLLDLCRSEQGAQVTEELLAKILKALASIQSQVTRGHVLTTDLNKLAHLPDKRWDPGPEQVDMCRIGALAARFMRRSASRAGVALVTPEEDACAPANGDPLLCLAACMVLLEWLWPMCESGGEIVLRAIAGEPALHVDMDPVPVPEEMPLDLRRLTAAAGLSIESDNGRLCIGLSKGEA